jgi:hypothetical protein
MNNDLDLSEFDKEIAASSPVEFLAESFTLYARTHGRDIWKGTR